MKKCILAAPLLLLAACGDDPAPETGEAAEGGELSGDVLEGTISDDMIALDQLTSTSPPAERASSDSDSGGAPAAEPAATPDEAPDAAEAKAPADAPAPETSESE